MIARAALESMHYAPGTFEEALASGPSALRSVPDAMALAKFAPEHRTFLTWRRAHLLQAGL